MAAATACSTPPKPPATRLRSRSRCSPTGSPSATPIPPRAGRPAPGPGDRPDSGNRVNESHLAMSSGPSEAEARRPAGRARSRHSGDPQLPRLGQHRHSAFRLGYVSPPFSTGSDATNRRPPSPVSPSSPLTAAAFPKLNTAIAHLRDVLGDQTYESLARKGETMTTAAMVTYAYDQIDQARAELNAVSK